MFKKVPAKYRKRYRIIIFLVLPLCFGVGFFLGTKSFLLLGYRIDLKGKVIVALSMVPLYIRGVFVINRKLREKGERDNSE